MVRRWLSTHKSLVVTATSGTVVAALVATAAVVSGGYTAQRVDLNDSSVWVANSTRQYVGRANTDIHLLDTVVASEGNDLAVVQSGSRILVVDGADARLDIVDAATAEVADTVPLPPDNSSVYMAGANVVIYSQGTGEAWIVPFDSLSDFDADQEPTLNLGADTVISVSPSGMLYGYTPSARRVSRVNAAVAGVIEQSTSGGFASTTGDYSITSVGSHWAVLDTRSGQLSVDGTLVPVGALVADGGLPQVQQPSQSGDRVLLGVRGGLVSVPVSGGAPSVVVEGQGGSAARPISFGGCDFAAWSSGVAWRHCATDSASGIIQPLTGIGVSPRLSFLANGDRLVVNDARSGASWAVLDKAELIDNWDDLIDEDKKDTTVKANDPDNPTVVEKNQQPPVAVDDELGARPGRTTVLPVLLNDYDPNGDVLVVESTGDIAAGVGRLDIVSNRQQVQLTLGEDAEGTVVFDYTISDGRGGSATAKVTVTVRTAAENSAPRQVRSTKVTVAAGAQQSLPVLGDWVDPDGDPFYLTSATVAKPDTVSYKPEGTIIFTASGTEDGTVPVALVVSDGTDEGTGSVSVTVKAAGKVPIVADPFAVLAYAGQEVTITPLEHVRGGSGTLRLNAVPAKSGVTITPSYENGTFRFSSDQVRTHYLEYIVTDNDQTATGLIRVDVAAPPDSNTRPITVPKTIFVRTLSSGIVNVASTDIDPAGGVLLVTGVSNVPARSGVRAEVLQQKSVRVTLVGLLDGPVTFGYQVSNGLAEVDGTITVIQIPRPRQIQPPVARDDTATARVGDAITIDVMANDEQPDGLAITMAPKLIQPLTGASGLLFVSGNTLRYLAPAKPGNFSAIYAIVGPDGQIAQAQVRIEVREPNAETNNPPVPTTVTARVLSGERVRIDIPLTGIDPDGDSVQLLGQESNPEKGAVVAVGTSYIDYEAGQYSAGTDSFTYAVIDALGARATGTVRIGITARQQGARNPIAIEDEVTARPGATVSVQVLENDSDPDGSPLTVTSVEPSDAATVASIEGSSIVTITPPAAEGRYGVLYTIENRFGGTSSNFITVRVSADAPLAYPIANDTVLTLSDVLDRTSIDVDVLKNVFFADGASRSLGLSVLSGYGGTAEVTAEKRIRVSIADASQIIPFVVSHPDDPAIRSYAFLWVPGFDDALPQLNRNARALSVLSEDALTINLNDYVLAVNGKKVRLTDSSTVRATHANGASLVVDSDTLQFVSADHYSGPASISFEVTDGTSAADANGRKAILVLPITVTARANQPPVFAGAVLEFEPGQRRTIDLGKITNYPYPQDLGQLVYSTVGAPPRGFTYTIAGRTLQITANEDVANGSTAALTLSVRDDLTVGQQGRIELRVVPSTRPLASPVADVARTERGRTTVIDVLQNDEATNPFPGEPLRVVRVAGLEGGNLPTGVTVVASNNGSRLTVTVADDAAPIDTNLQYEVADATNDPARYTFGTVRISVQDAPDAPARPQRQADSFVGGELKLRISPPQSNNSPITGYTIVSSSHGDYSQDCGTTLICSLRGLQVGAEYRFSVIAKNDIGPSEPSSLSDVYTVDYKPAAPSNVSAVPSPATAAPNGKSITVSWPTVPNPDPGTAVIGYTVEISGSNVSFSANATSPFTTTAGGQLSNDTNYTVSVYARNRSQVVSESEWRRGSTDVRTVGPPSTPRPSPKAAINSDNANGEVRVTWGTSDPNGASSVTYSVGRVTGGTGPDSCATGNRKPGLSAGSGGTVSSGWIDTNTTDGTSYTYIVYADNGFYCTATAIAAIESTRPPGQASGSASIVERTPGGGQFDIVAGGDLEASGIVNHFEYRLNGSSTWRAVPADRYLTSRSDASYYGLETTVTFRGCRDNSSNLCGDESPGTTVTPVNVRAGIQSCIVGSVPLPTAPENAGTVEFSYQYSYYRTLLGVGLWTGFSYSSDDEVPSNSARVRVRATATIGADNLVDSGYGEGECSRP